MLKRVAEPDPDMLRRATRTRELGFALQEARDIRNRSLTSEFTGGVEKVRELDHPAPSLDAKKPLLIVLNHLLEYKSSNIAGAMFLRSGRGLVLRDGKVTGTTDRMNRWLGDLIGKASDEGFRSVHEWETPPGTHRGNGSWVVTARRLSGNSSVESLVMMTAQCIAASEPMSGRDAVELFGLTPAEGRLAIKLASGLALDEIAAIQETQMTTLRAQLRSIFVKTGTTRQAQLVAHIWRVSVL
jgi:DNA-binding CsgD family transcriptional regulator